MNRHGLRVLEFEKIRGRVRDRCLTDEASTAIRRERVQTDPDRIRALLDRVGVLKSCLASTVESPDLGFPPVTGILERLSREGVVLEPLELANIAQFTKSSVALHEYLYAAAEQARTGGRAAAPLTDRLAEFVGDHPPVHPVYERLFRYVDPDGSVREREIPELRSIRSEILRAEQDLQKSAAALAQRDDVKRLLSATVPTQRDGRTVLALKADHRGKLHGIVHEVSGSGATIFVEPEELVVRNNAVVEAENRYRNELLRIMRDLSRFCREAIETLRETVALAVETDRALCRARFAQDYSCQRADLGARRLLLRRARHPLLGDAAVPINVDMPEDKRVLIVTGPNTGGKTVTLKTIGLLALMNQFGLEIPAAPGSELPVFSGVYADIGDEQSIEQNLSTFSGHMRNIARILNHADDTSLVLLDELGSGTDPEEGGALAMAMLDELLRRRPFTVVTTHHGRLKHYGFTHPQALNASVEFDPDSLRPTYHIIPGVPGSSHAVEIAAQMGILRSVTTQAKAYLAGEEYDTGRIIRRLTDREQELRHHEQRVGERERELEAQARSMSARADELDRRERELRSGKIRELEQWAGEARSRLENLVREIREGELTREKTQAVKAYIAETGEELAREREASGPVGRRPDGQDNDSFRPDLQLAEGTAVRVRSSGKEGVVHRRGKGSTWVVQLGPVRLPVEEQDLVPVRRRAEGLSVSYAGAVGGEQAPAFELDLRGYRLEDALAAVERQIDRALLFGLSDFGIVHGMGEGVLQQGVRDLLRRHTHVAHFEFARPEEGGFGRTDVHLQ